MRKGRLFTPGPTPVPPEVTLRQAYPILHHRSPAFKTLFTRINQKLPELFKVHGPVISLAASGTGAMEAAVVNLLSPGERALTIEGGKFGQRWTELCRAYGVETERLSVEWGSALDPDRLAQRLQEPPEIHAIFVTQVETSTGVLFPLRELARTVQDASDALIIVDAVSSLGGEELLPEAWGLDVVVSGSQKGMSLPPGLGFAWLSARAWDRASRLAGPRYYFDLIRARKALEGDETPFTPAVSLLMGLDEALALILEEGVEASWTRHRRLARATRAGCSALALELFPRSPAHVLTALKVPEGLDGGEVVRALAELEGLTVAGGQAALKGKIFRIAHVGYFDEQDVVGMLGGLERALSSLGYSVEPGAAVAAGQRALALEPAD